MNYSHIKVIILIALKKELPSIPFSKNVSHITLNSLQANNTQNINITSSILIITTGVGYNNAIRTVKWVTDHTSPLIIFNFGSCGIKDPSIPLGTTYTLSKERLPVTPKIKLNHPPSPCIDMESEAYLSHFENYKIPFYCIKTVTDYDNTQLDIDFNRMITTVQSEFKRLFGWVYQKEITPHTISVIIPTYNRAHYLPRCIESILNQTTLPKELIVVDDGSTDHTPNVLSRYPQIKVITNIHNKGVSYTRNHGINASSGQWIMLLDSDDEWLPSKVESQIKHLNQHPYYLITQTLDQWIKNGQPVTQPTHLHRKSGWLFNESLNRCTISPSSVCFHRSLWEEYGPFNEDYPACEDYDLWLKITRHHPIGLDETYNLIRYAGHSDQLSSTVQCVDQFRVNALFSLFNSETDFAIKDQIKGVLLKKLSILINGAKKRDQNVASYQKIATQLDH
jgi:glycosyltransferase involved in cell wall biosynthesis/nucleoside phosphorylase